MYKLTTKTELRRDINLQSYHRFYINMEQQELNLIIRPPPHHHLHISSIFLSYIYTSKAHALLLEVILTYRDYVMLIGIYLVEVIFCQIEY